MDTRANKITTMGIISEEVYKNKKYFVDEADISPMKRISAPGRTTSRVPLQQLQLSLASADTGIPV